MEGAIMSVSDATKLYEKIIKCEANWYERKIFKTYIRTCGFDELTIYKILNKNIESILEKYAK